MPNLKRAAKLKTTILPDGYVAIFSAPTDYAYTLPPLGALAWEFFDGEHSIDQLVEDVARALGSEETAELHEQIVALTKELQRSGFLEECSA
jgi:hypothetical protein